MEQVEAGFQNYVEQVEQEQGGFQIPWNKWNNDKWSFQLSSSSTSPLDPMWNYKAVE